MPHHPGEISLSVSRCLGDRDGTPAVVSTRHSSCRNARRHSLGRLLSPLRGGPLVDRSLSAGREEISNPLRIASSDWAEGSAPLTSSWSGSAASLSPSRSGGGRAITWGGSSFGPGSSLASLSDSSVSGTWVCMGSCFSCPTTGLGLNTAGAGSCSASLGDPPPSDLGRCPRATRAGRLDAFP